MAAHDSAKTMKPGSRPARRGSSLVVVLGLMGVLAGLILAVTFRVRAAVVNNGNFQRSIESFIMVQTAKLLIEGRYDHGALPGPAVTAGDQVDLAAAGRPYANSTGWLHLKPGGSGTFDIIATGGSAGEGGVKSGAGTIWAGDPVQNTFEVRYHYTIAFDPTISAPGSRFTIDQQMAQDNSLYPW